MSHILIVDDQPDIRECLRWYFEELKLDCSEAENGLDALQKAQQTKPDLVILDFSMPVMNGVEAARIQSNYAGSASSHADRTLWRRRRGSKECRGTRCLCKR